MPNFCINKSNFPWFFSNLDKYFLDGNSSDRFTVNFYSQMKRFQTLPISFFDFLNFSIRQNIARLHQILGSFLIFLIRQKYFLCRLKEKLPRQVQVYHVKNLVLTPKHNRVNVKHKQSMQSPWKRLNSNAPWVNNCWWLLSKEIVELIFETTSKAQQ